MKTIIASEDELSVVVDYLNATIPKDAIIFLVGDLASGKTTLTQYIARDRGVDGEITSPTFSLQQCYSTNLYHYDLYRIDNSEFMELGLFEEFDKSGWHMVEWGDKALKEFLLSVGYDIFTITITPYKDRRKYIIEKS